MASRSGAGNALPGSILLVVHDFVARSPDELSLAKGDRIELIERDDDFGDGWFLGKHMTNGNSGLFPEVYTTPAPKGTLTGGVGRSRYLGTNTNDAAPMLAAQTAAANLAGGSGSNGVSQRSASATQSMPPAASGAQASLAQASLRTSLPVNAATAGRNFTTTSDSPVMNETLSVIDEHITDMNSPRTSYANGNTKRDTMSSVYSTQPLVRRSYIAGHETDEEEHQLHTEEEVMGWGPARVAEYLEDHGVEKAHCEVFKEQEISGEVLLAMDQNSLFIKEFDLGAIGRRLKTWHKIKALQDETKRSASPGVHRDGSVSEYSLGLETEESSTGDSGRNRSSTVGAPSLPRALTTKRRSGDAMPTRSSTVDSTVAGASDRASTGMSPLQAMTSVRRSENTYRPSAQGIRQLNHSRRHSSIDSTSTDGANRASHRKKPSIDQKWEPGQAVNGRHAYTISTDDNIFPQRIPGVTSPSSPEDLDRGYFSSNEVDSRRKSVLTKRNSAVVSPMQSRTGSFLSPTSDISRDPVSPIVPSIHHQNASAAVNSKFGNYRSATTGSVISRPPNGINPVVTKLDPSSSQSLNAIAASPTAIQDNASDASSEKVAASPSRLNMGMFQSARAKVTGLRTTSDAVTKGEKASKGDHAVKSPARTGSSTPSTGEKSLDLSKSDLNSRASTGSGGLVPPPPVKRPRAKTKTKKSTSAYTRGLEKKAPQEQMIDCDYSGWMKKKSGSLMTTWKPRLFILKGCRLSYYYADDDTEEKGLIDIAFHRVLPAHNETMTNFHAAITGNAGSPSSPLHGTTPTMAEQDLRNHPPKKGEEGEGLFIFKLVPPKAGLAKGVSFTKPTVHYFAVNSRQEGRLWMAALMKATIDRDDNGVVTTTYNQKTISLAKARERKERPPALREDDDLDGRAELAGDEDSERGLGIGGIEEKDSAMAGAEERTNGERVDDTSLAPSTNATGTEDELNEKERLAVAMNAS
ncbi:Protein BOI2 [Pseudocercospora fuligena]|uniref:Protein BOI2 n=1 Tax=Pseudocercospora fuligena TaxID=685502 RepID=A0A8H6RRM1_9PEZI|nr:Protein BOI2 [Pseudocercospora fuligena]